MTRAPAPAPVVVGRLQVRVLLDTGPTTAELATIEDLFGARGMDAGVEGHSYGGPPPTSAFRIVLDVPLAPFLDSFAQEPGTGWRSLGELVAALQSMRADPADWGRAHVVHVEDAASGHSVRLDPALPEEAYRALLDIDLSGLDQWSVPVELGWQPALTAWKARMTTVPVRFSRRPPPRRAAPAPLVRQVGEEEMASLWALAGSAGTPAVSWQRAQMVLLGVQGSTAASIAQHVVTGEARVRAVLDNFNRDGFASFDMAYTAGHRPQVTEEEERDAREVLRRGTWDAAELGEFLVAEGVVEDVDLAWLTALLTRREGSG
ncbi:hypothetical protein [Modestobacter sp. Leaf380]|uniref:hypothetical protein n=1 Tax=Modestobacter sp. Leaf380 TaxID=1736356 RepID=UPI0012F90B08|nr:hypothetical protein [Modestobacter sp. Leaf380]